MQFRLFGCFVTLCLATAALAGDLNPPGAIAPTMLRLDEVEPSTPIGPLTTPGDASATYVITQPGVYHFTGNLTGEVGKDGLRIDTNHVLIDMHGFTFFGVVGSLDGIGSTPAGGGDVTLLNGTLADWGGWGVNLELGGPFVEPQAQNGLFHRVRGVNNAVGGVRSHGSDGMQFIECVAAENGQFGLSGGVGARFVRCQAMNNGGTGNAAGITGNFSCTFIDCVSQSNDDWGISTGIYATVQNCTAVGNGLSGFNVGYDSVVTGCVSTVNQDYGFRVEERVDLRDCSASENEDGGYRLLQDVSLRDCSAWENNGDGFGLFIDPAPRVSMTGCTASGNVGSGIVLGAGTSLVECQAVNNGGDGIVVGPGSAIRNCTSNLNTNGMVFDDGTLIENCVVRENVLYGMNGEDTTSGLDDGQSRINGCVIDSNGQNGIRVEDQTLITNNQVSLNGQAAGADNGGILILSRGSRIDSNEVTQNSGAGVRLLDSRNIVVRNNFMLNSVHIIDVPGTNHVGAFNGVLTAGPWDNFQH